MALRVCNATNGRSARVLNGLKKLSRFFFRLKSWLPVLWHDEDYDHNFLLKIIRHKVARMREHFIHWSAWGVPHPNMIKRMRIVELLIGRLVEANYCQYEHEQWQKQMPGIGEEKIMDIAHQAQHLEDQDWGMVFDLIKRHGRRWWD